MSASCRTPASLYPTGHACHSLRPAPIARAAMRGLARSSHCRRRRACYDGAKFPRFPSVHVTETHTPHRQAVPNAPPVSIDAIHTVVADALASTPFIDIHTHLYPPSFGDVGLWGIDALLTYHYLEAEVFRSRAIRPEDTGRSARRRARM